MADVRLLLQGEAVRRMDGWTASPNTTLIKAGGKTILVDPGNHPGILDLLEMRSVWPEDIDIVFLTHYHLDHTLNASLFRYAEVMDVKWRYNGNDIIEHSGMIRGTGIKVIPTPGHSPDCSTLLVNTRDGVTAICGDLFWFSKGQLMADDIEGIINMRDELAFDNDLLLRNRTLVMEQADLIIPGHGDPFRTNRIQ